MSSAEEAQQLPPQTPSFAMLRTLGGVAMLAGFLVVMVFQWTKPIIDENKRIAIEKAVFRVVPGAASRTDYVLGSDGLFKAEEAEPGQGEKIYAAYDEQGAQGYRHGGGSHRLRRRDPHPLRLQPGLRMCHRYQGIEDG